MRCSSPDVRARWGVIIPSTNVMVERDFAMLCPFAVSVHTGRAYISSPSMASDADAMRLLDQMDAEFDRALRDVLTAEPSRIIIAMSAEVMRRGVTAGAEFVAEVAQRAGVPVTTGPEATIAALQAIGAHRIALLTPYQAQSDELTKQYFHDSGFEVTAIHGLCCVSATDIAAVATERIVDAMRQLAQSTPDAIVQVGTNLSSVRLCAEAERWLGIPAIAMNAATMWWALRQSGIRDQRDDAGVLFRFH